MKPFTRNEKIADTMRKRGIDIYGHRLLRLNPNRLIKKSLIISGRKKT